MLDKIIAFVAPPDEDAPPRRIFYWRLTISGFVLLLLFHILHILGGVKGLDGVAFADDVDKKINMKIEMAIAPINSRLEAIESEQSTASGYLKTLVRSDFKRLIDRELLARCANPSRSERDRINAAIEAYQVNYESVFGVRYVEPRCEAL